MNQKNMIGKRVLLVDSMAKNDGGTLDARFGGAEVNRTRTVDSAIAMLEKADRDENQYNLVIVNILNRIGRKVVMRRAKRYLPEPDVVSDYE
jgi:hypothetical protein